MTTTMVRPALKATGLRKSFGEKTALDGIDLIVAEGSIFALLGPNGGRQDDDRAASPSLPSSRRCADCSWARRSATAPS